MYKLKYEIEIKKDRLEEELSHEVCHFYKIIVIQKRLYNNSDNFIKCKDFKTSFAICKLIRKSVQEFRDIVFSQYNASWFLEPGEYEVKKILGFKNIDDVMAVKEWIESVLLMDDLGKASW